MRDRVDQEGSASRSLAKADRYLAQAEQMAVELAADPGNEKLQKKMAKRYKRAAENAAKAISMDSNLSGAYRTKGLAYLGLDEASSAHGACRMAFGLDRDDIEALHCFGKASLLRGIATDVEVTARELAKHDEAAFKSFREEIQAWVTENPDHEASERLSVYLNR